MFFFILTQNLVHLGDPVTFIGYGFPHRRGKILISWMSVGNVEDMREATLAVAFGTLV